MRAAITAVGHFVPCRRLTNADLEAMVDTNDQWITSRTGIRERRIAEPNQATAHMAVRAAQNALAQRRLPAADLDLILLATVTPDMPVPSAAAFVQKGLGALKAWGFDINGGCCGFICALAAASQFIETGRCAKALVIGADKMSAILDYSNRNTCVLFGDGAGAVLLESCPDDEPGILDHILHLDGSGAEFLKVPAGGSLQPATHDTVERRLHFVHQEGRTVFKQAITGMIDVSQTLLARNRLQPRDLKLMIPHQANLRIIEAVAQKLELTADQVMVNIDRYGNTTAATIPIAMSEAYSDQRMEKNDIVLMTAFGAGFTWGALLLRWAMEKPQPGQPGIQTSVATHRSPDKSEFFQS
jgi:3-oxoacyl-[acyl-carrier-protein] synthase-3